MTDVPLGSKYASEIKSFSLNQIKNQKIKKGYSIPTY